MWRYNSELYHWGIKGMKWGVRRYQNKDGTLTPLGKQRLQEKIDSVKTRQSRSSYESKRREYEQELESMKKSGYKQWAKDNYYDDYSDRDQKELYDEYMHEVQSDIKIEQFFADNVDLLYKKLSTVESNSHSYKEAMELVTQYEGEWIGQRWKLVQKLY